MAHIVSIVLTQLVSSSVQTVPQLDARCLIQECDKATKESNSERIIMYMVGRFSRV